MKTAFIDDAADGNLLLSLSHMTSSRCAGKLAMRPCKGHSSRPCALKSGAPLLDNPQRHKSSSKPSSQPKPVGSAMGTNLGCTGPLHRRLPADLPIPQPGFPNSHAARGQKDEFAASRCRFPANRRRRSVRRASRRHEIVVPVIPVSSASQVKSAIREQRGRASISRPCVGGHYRAAMPFLHLVQAASK